MNYTVITSQCKGPNYTPQRCCEPLKELLCPVKDQVNDLKSSCADTFFSYVNLYGKYPPGLFASLCREGQMGLECPAPAPIKSGAVGSRSSALVMLVAGLVVAAMFYI
ncbi:hypothetical protein RD792_006240 [Penstemon davidsonii]|uniref:GPI-anchored protein LLG1-like domain-containing protein n=1 Tax=Penstemon davidsonii TaxID=160366 RepID=A0ABR0DD12_9LAMI|nr:hypothetical protein RD792_006240 [Penstemon davidsonii]